MNAITEIYGGLKSLVIGMQVTIRQFFKPSVTVQYPHATLKIPLRYRGHIELVGDPATGKPLCFVCKLCERACPSDCITVDGTKFEGDRRKSVTRYNLDFTKCSLCGSCVEVCRDGAIQFSRDYNLAGLTKGEFIFDLLQRYKSQHPEAQPGAPAPKSSAEPKPQAEPVPQAKPEVQLAAAATSQVPAP